MAAEATKRDLDTRERTIELTVASIEKQFGKGAIMRLGAEGKLGKDIPIISTGSLGLDIALGTGGMPRGRIAEVFGPESSGKTTLALHVIAEAQRAGGICAFIDAEHALDVQYARKLGVRTDDLLISQPDFGEQALEIADMLVRSAAISVIVVDSVAALTPRAELEGEMGDAHVGLQARLMSQALRKLTATIHRSETMLLFINQIRMKIGVMFGSPETTTGGNALKFYSSVRLDIRRIGAIKQGEVVVGNRTRVKVVKNKLAPPFRQVEFDIIYGEGISTVGDLVDLGAEEGVLEKSGAWYAYAGERIGQGRENAKQYLKDHPELAAQLREALMRKAGLLTDATAAAEAPKSEVPKGDASKGDSAKSEAVAKGVGLKGATGGAAASAAAPVAPAPIVAASATVGSGNGSGKSAPRLSK
ncbi:MAG: recombinase RecA [Proteobacteria bacterium]|nr:recombinase RecA [Pseudomonadota bacterium]